MTSGSPGLQCPAAISRATTSRSWRRGHLGVVVVRAEPHRVQRQRPGRPARPQRDDARVRPPRHCLARPSRARARAEQPLRAGLRVGPQPVRHVHREPDPPVRPRRQRQPGQRPPQPGEPRPPRVQRVIERPVAAAALRRQGQLRQVMTRPARTKPRRTTRTAHPGGKKDQYSSWRNPASRRAPPPPRTSPPSSFHAIIKATATASLSSGFW